MICFGVSETYHIRINHFYPRRELIDFYDGVIMSGHFLRPPNMLTKFFKDPKYVDQIFRNPPKLCWSIFSRKCFLLTTVFWNTFLSRDPNSFTKIFFLSALKISDPKYVDLPSVSDPKYAHLS